MIKCHVLPLIIVENVMMSSGINEIKFESIIAFITVVMKDR